MVREVTLAGVGRARQCGTNPEAATWQTSPTLGPRTAIRPSFAAGRDVAGTVAGIEDMPAA
jgi:hypothetical protein